MLAERTGDGSAPHRGGLQIQVSKLLLTSVIAAIATSVAMIVVAVMIMQGPPPPGAGGSPPPPPLTPLVLIIVVTGMFVVSWLAVVAVLARDQVLRQLRDRSSGAGADPELVDRLRADLAEDRRADLALLEARIAALTAEYGEQRETDGYVNGMRTAARPPTQGAEVRALHRIPPA